MSKRFFFIAALIFPIVVATAQEGSPSPYSFYGIGTFQFKGTAENRAMGGLSVFSDSIHINFRNPASYGNLDLTTFTVGGNYKSITLKSNSGEDQVSNSTLLEYMALAFPVGKFGFGFGLVPYTSVGYELQNLEDEVFSEFSGSGGLNRVFLSAGYEINEHLTIGAEAHYNFGNIQNKSLFLQNQIQFGTREINRSDLTGFSYNFGAQYRRKISKKLEMRGSVSYSPSSRIESENYRQVATVLVQANGDEIISDAADVEVPNSELTVPSQLLIGGGIGEINKWFAGVEYGQTGTSNYSNRSFEVAGAQFSDASRFAIGGYYLPDYNDITSYFKRITYRAGARYEETGLSMRGEDINEFGISFGLGLPIGRKRSNLNIGFEYGQRGTTRQNLVEETFFNVFVGISFNDLWFQKSKYN